MADRIIDRDSLQDIYVETIIDGMDDRDMYAFVKDNLNDHLDKYSVNELILEVEEYYPELLEESDAN